MRKYSIILIMLAVFTFAYACDDDDNNQNEADIHGIGASCTEDASCTEEGQVCLLDFKGGYCGSVDCTEDASCYEGSRCVTLDATNYCFLICTDKDQCNENRGVDEESNCSASVVFVEDATTEKACIPPSGK
jgi:hypothetical protein